MFFDDFAYFWLFFLVCVCALIFFLFSPLPFHRLGRTDLHSEGASPTTIVQTATLYCGRIGGWSTGYSFQYLGEVSIRYLLG